MDFTCWQKQTPGHTDALLWRLGTCWEMLRPILFRVCGFSWVEMDYCEPHARKNCWTWCGTEKYIGLATCRTSVFVPGVPRKRCFVSTQLPMKTVTFWRIKTSQAGGNLNIGVRFLKRVLKARRRAAPLPWKHSSVRFWRLLTFYNGKIDQHEFDEIMDDEQPNSKPKKKLLPKKEEKAMTRMLWILWKVNHNCVSQDSDALFSHGGKPRWNPMQKVLEPIRKGHDSQSPRYVIRVSGKRKDHRLGKTQVKLPHQRSPYAVKFEDSSHEETERQQRCARSRAWNLAKNIQVQRKRQGCILLSRGGMGTPGCVNERAGGKRVWSWFRSESTHMVSKKDPNSAELETMRTSRSSTTVMTANGEVQTRDATVYVKEWTYSWRFCFLKKLPQFVLSGNSARIMFFPPLDQRSKTTTHQKRQETYLQYIQLCSICGSWFISEFFLNYTFTYFSIMFITGFRVWCQQTENPVPERSGSTSEEVRVSTV